MLFGFCESAAWWMHRYRSSTEQSSPPSCECVVGSHHRSWPSTLRSTDMCSEDHPTLAELVERADDELLDDVLINSGHVLYNILPRETVSTYSLRRRRHNRELTSTTTHLEQCSFIVRMLFLYLISNSYSSTQEKKKKKKKKKRKKRKTHAHINYNKTRVKTKLCIVSQSWLQRRPY